MSQIRIISKTWQELGVQKQIAQYFHPFKYRINVVTNVGILKLTFDAANLNAEQLPTSNPNRNHFYHAIDVAYVPTTTWIKIAGDTEWIRNNKNELLRTLITDTTPFTIGDPRSSGSAIIVYARGLIWTFCEAGLIMRFSSYSPADFQTRKYELDSTTPIIPESKAKFFDSSPYQLRIDGYDYAIYQPATRMLYHYTRYRSYPVRNIPGEYTMIDFGIAHEILFIVYADNIGNVYVNYDSACAKLGKLNLDLNSNVRVQLNSEYVIFVSDVGIMTVRNLGYNYDCYF